MKYCYRCGKDKAKTDFRRVYNREGKCLNRMAICENCEAKLYAKKKRPPRTNYRRLRELAMLGNPFEKTQREEENTHHLIWSICV